MAHQPGTSRHDLRSQRGERYVGGWLPLQLREGLEQTCRQRGLSITEALREALAGWVDERAPAGQEELPV